MNILGFVMPQTRVDHARRRREEVILETSAKFHILSVEAYSVLTYLVRYLISRMPQKHIVLKQFGTGHRIAHVSIWSATRFSLKL